MKKIVAVILLLSVVSIASVMHTVPNKAVNTSSDYNNKKTIIIDAGHGGFDGGAVAADGTAEKDINLNIALMLGDFLTLSGYDVIYTRQTDISTEDKADATTAHRKKSDLQNRLALMKKYDQSIFVSIHLNKFTTSSANGAQVFYAPKISGARPLSEHIQKSIVSQLQPDNTRVVKMGTKSTYLLYNASVPAVIVECGFLSNQNDLTLLKDAQYQGKMAFSIYCGILKYYENLFV